jgi:cellular nucleic acid-binding protein
MKCYACGKLVRSSFFGPWDCADEMFQGHISRDCTAPNGGPLNTAGKTCYRCGEAGHISRDCPQSEGATNGAAAPVDAAAAPAPVAAEPAAAPPAV